MPIDPQLENYLGRLDRALGQIAVSERSDIVTEIKSHVLSSMERDPSQPMSKVLGSLGEPETVANRYLMERGLKPSAPPKSPMVKWITIGFLGTLSLGLISLILLIYKFTPLISVDEAKGKVQLLGGMIDINESVLDGIDIDGKVTVNGSNTRHVVGDQKIAKDTKEIAVRFLNGKMEIGAAKDGMMSWDCKITGGDARVETKGGVFTLDMSSALGTKCQIFVPKIAGKLTINGTNGKLELDGLQNATDASLANGKIDVRPDRTLEYRYNNSVVVGKVDAFPSSKSPKALPIALHVGNGKIDLE